MTAGCATIDPKQTLRKQLAEHQVRNISIWGEWNKTALAQRVRVAPQFLVDYIALDNQLNNIKLIPSIPKHANLFAKDVIAAINDLPEVIQKQLQAHAIGIFLISGLGSSGYNDVVKDFEKHHAGFIVLDVDTMQNANDWATWKEGTPFVSSAKVDVSVRLADEKNNNRKTAISYILLHEFGHLIGAVNGAHSLWWNRQDPKKYPFSSISWLLKDDQVHSTWDKQFSERNTVRFYVEDKDKLPVSVQIQAYKDLHETDFVSLYGSLDEFEDFAEAYAMYVHVVMQKQPWQFKLRGEGKLLMFVEAPILQDRCAAKRTYFEKLLMSSK